MVLWRCGQWDCGGVVNGTVEVWSMGLCVFHLWFDHFRPKSLKDLYAYAFKVTHDKRRGPMVYLRLYSGKIEPHTTIYNISRSKE